MTNRFVYMIFAFYLQNSFCVLLLPYLTMIGCSLPAQTYTIDHPG